MRKLIVPLALVLALPAGLYAQSLGEVAAKERERREKLRQGKHAPKVITEEDLRAAGRPRGTVSNPGATNEPAADPNAPAAPGAAPASPAPAGKEKSEEEMLAQRQAQWRERMKRAQEDVQGLNQRAEQLQLRLNDTGNVYAASRTNLMNELETTKALLATARQALASLEDEGRRSGFQP